VALLSKLSWVVLQSNIEKQQRKFVALGKAQLIIILDQTRNINDTCSLLWQEHDITASMNLHHDISGHEKTVLH